MTTTKPYPAYKPSGIEWLGDVPAHWEVRRVKGCVTNIIDLTREHLDDELYLALEHVESWTGRVSSNAGDGVSFSGQVKRFKAKDVLFGKLRPYLAKVTCPKRSGVCVGEFLVLRPHDAHLSTFYLEQLLRSKPVIDAIDSSTFGAKMPRADWKFIGDLLFPLPPLAEQRAIVKHLDHADTRIRRYIDAKQKLIELLEEERQALISRAVTRGIDHNVRLRPSGVEWLGDVPAHWEVVQLGKIGAFSKGSGGTKNDEVPRGIPCIRYGDLYTTHKCFITQTRSYVSPTKASAYTPINRGDILFPASGETIEEIGKSAVNLMHTRVICGGDLIIFRPTIPMEPKFAGYALDCPAAQTQKSMMARGVTIMHIYSSQLKYLLFPLPPLAEQRAIVKHLDRATGDIDAAIARARRQVELLQEYRERLIADVVTGKLDVREAAEWRPEESESPTGDIEKRSEYIYAGAES